MGGGLLVVGCVPVLVIVARPSLLAASSQPAYPKFLCTRARRSLSRLATREPAPHELHELHPARERWCEHG